MIFSFCHSSQERVEVDVLWRQSVPVSERQDSPRLFAQVQVRAGGFRGQTDAAIVQEHLASFLVQLRRLHETSRGIAELSGVHGQFSLRLKRDSQGLIELAGEVAEQPGVGARLRFLWRFERERLAETIRELAGIASQFCEKSAPSVLEPQYL